MDLCEDAENGHRYIVGIILSETDNFNRALQVQQAASMASYYIRKTKGSYLENLKVYYPDTNGTHYSNNEIHLLKDDYCDWDVIQHEYGHHVEKHLGISQSPGGKHVSTANLADSRQNKDQGVKLAWAEGWATYYAICVQDSLNAKNLNIPNVGDNRYSDTIDTSVGYSLEKNSLKLGEANERTVASVLYDVADNGTNESWDKLSMGYGQVNNYIFNNKCVMLSAFISKIQSIDNVKALYIGDILSDAGVSSQLSGPVNGSKMTSSLPTFSWIKGGGSKSYPNNSFVLVFYNSSYSKICEISVGNVSSYTLTRSQWSKICAANTSGKLIYWTVKASQKSSPVTGPYHSNYRYFYIP